MQIRGPNVVILFDNATLTGGGAEVFIRCAQLGVLDDWFADGGYSAGVQRVALTVAHN